jgi:hypothetical protein
MLVSVGNPFLSLGILLDPDWFGTRRGLNDVQKVSDSLSDTNYFLSYVSLAYLDLSWP